MPYIKLYCDECENYDCLYCKNGEMTYRTNNNLEVIRLGCCKEVSDITLEKYFHYLEEVVPFGISAKQYKEIIDFLFTEIYSAKTHLTFPYPNKKLS